MKIIRIIILASILSSLFCFMIDPLNDIKKTCRNFSYHGHCLYAECKQINGEWYSTRVKLNKCLTNMNGSLIWKKNGNYSSTSKECRVKGSKLICNSKDSKKIYRYAAIDLKQKIINRNGYLVCKNNKTSKERYHKLVSSKIVTKKKNKNCNETVRLGFRKLKNILKKGIKKIVKTKGKGINGKIRPVKGRKVSKAIRSAYNKLKNRLKSGMKKLIRRSGRINKNSKKRKLLKRKGKKSSLYKSKRKGKNGKNRPVKSLKRRRVSRSKKSAFSELKRDIRKLNSKKGKRNKKSKKGGLIRRKAKQPVIPNFSPEALPDPNNPEETSIISKKARKNSKRYGGNGKKCVPMGLSVQKKKSKN